MHISISREDLLKPLGHVAGIVERRQTLPILSNLLINAQQDKLSLTGTDLEVEVVATLSTPAETTGDVTVPARKLLDICRALPADARLDIQQSGEKVVVKSGKSRFSLLSLPARDFPSIETSDWDLRISLPQHTLKSLFERTQFSMAQQDVRYYLNGLLLELDGKQLRAVATDGHRMAISSITHDADSVEGNKQIIVPKKGVHELTRFLEDSDTAVEIAISSNHMRATLPHMIFTTKLIDGRFPDYNKVIPESQSKHIMLNREQFRDALNRAAILSNEKYRGIRFAIRPGTLTITAHNPDQEEAQEELSIDYSGEEMEVGFNSNYVIEAAAALETAEIELGLQDANSSGTLRAPGDERTQYVIMPMRL